MNRAASQNSPPSFDQRLRRNTSIRLAFMTPPLQSLVRAVDLADKEGWDLALVDIVRIEARWEMVDACSTSHGFVLALTDGRRAYLQYVSDEEVEEVEILPMGDERYPLMGAGGFEWTDQVGDLNSFLKA
jgi:hypothetical protein